MKGGTCMGKMRNVHECWSGNIRKDAMWKTRHRQEDNIPINLIKIKCKCANWFQLLSTGSNDGIL
jgi:hypothetical protein